MSSNANFTVSRPELLQDGSDLEFRQLIHDILAFSSRIQEVRNGFGRLLNLTGGQYTILIAISHLQGRVGIGANVIAEALHLSSASVTIEVNKLVAQGLVDKGLDPTDGRRVRLQITKEGRRRLDALKSVQAPVNDTIFASLSRAEFRALRSIMSHLVVHSDEALALLDFYATKTGSE